MEYIFAYFTIYPDNQKKIEYYGIFTTIDDVNWQYEQLKNTFDKSMKVDEYKLYDDTIIFDSNKN